MSWSVRSRRVPLLLALAVGLCLTLVALPGPARADFPGATTPNGQTGRVGGCFATAGPNYLGLACPGAGADTGEPKYPPSFLCTDDKVKGEKGPLNDKQRESCEKPPGCWDSDPLTKEELASTGFENTPGPDGLTYYWQRCLRGISDDLADRGGNVTQSPESRPNSVTEVVTITEKQRNLMSYYFDPATGGQSPPTPSPLASPNLTPRVRTDVSFYDGTLVDPDDADAQDPGNRSSVLVEAAGTQLIAVEESILITVPDTDKTVRCARQGPQTPGSPGFNQQADVGYRAELGQTAENTPEGNCWYQFTRSSADQKDETYQISGTSHWKVWAKEPGGAWAPFTSLGGNEVEFDKTGSVPLKVSEVQAINVLPNGVLS